MPGFIQRRIFTIHSYDKVADIKDVKTNREVNMGFFAFSYSLSEYNGINVLK